jgi:hypothetical protein
MYQDHHDYTHQKLVAVAHSLADVSLVQNEQEHAAGTFLGQGLVQFP